MRGLLLYIKFLLLTILLGTTKSCSVVRFAVCPSGAGFLMTGPNGKMSPYFAVCLVFCRISLVMPYFFSFLPFLFSYAVLVGFCCFPFSCRLSCFLAVSPVCGLSCLLLDSFCMVFVFLFWLGLGYKQQNKRQRPFMVAVYLFVLSVCYGRKKLSKCSRLWLYVTNGLPERVNFISCHRGRVYCMPFVVPIEYLTRA